MKPRSYNHVDYGEANKPHKRKLEKDNAAKIDEKGGCFLITGPPAPEHYHTYRRILRERSPFDIYEWDPKTYRTIQNRTRGIRLRDKRVRIHYGDVFDVLKKKLGRVPLYVYAHLDFCITAMVLCREYKLKENLERLAAWDNSKRIFYLEITFTLRHDNKFDSGKNWGVFILEKYIPMIFKRYGWKVENPKGHAQKKKGWKYSRSYSDGCPMINGFYKFTRI